MMNQETRGGSKRLGSSVLVAIFGVAVTVVGLVGVLGHADGVLGSPEAIYSVGMVLSGVGLLAATRWNWRATELLTLWAIAGFTGLHAAMFLAFGDLQTGIRLGAAVFGTAALGVTRWQRGLSREEIAKNLGNG